MAMQAEPLRAVRARLWAFGDDSGDLQAVRDDPSLCDDVPAQPGRRVLHQPGRRSRQRRALRGYFALDDAARRKLGVPVVDKHRYARENGWMIHALATAYTVTGDRTYLDDAQRAARWIIANRSLSGGGFRHDERDAAGPYLEDTLAMSDAFLALYTATGCWRMAGTRRVRPLHRAAFSGPATGVCDERTARRLAAAAAVEHRREHSPRPLCQPAASLYRRRALPDHERLRVAHARDRADCKFPAHGARHPARRVRSRERSAAHHDRRRQGRRRGRDAVRSPRFATLPSIGGSSGGTAARATCRIRMCAIRNCLALPRSSARTAPARCRSSMQRR